MFAISIGCPYKMEHATFLKPLYGKIVEKKLWGFDIETATKKNDFVMGSIVGDDNIKKTFWNKNEFTDFLLKKSWHTFSDGYIAATNLQFDFLSLFEKTKYFSEIQPLIKNSKMIHAKIPLNRWESLKFIDTLSFAPFSVEKWGKVLNCPKIKKPDFLGHAPSSEKEKKELEDYNLRDAEITYKAMKFLQHGFNSLGANLKITIASTAMDLFRRQYLKQDLYQPEKFLLDFLFRSYYGGRTEIIKRGKIKNLNYYDVNSLYPSVMLNEYPNPNYMKFCDNVSLSNIMEYDGVCRVDIETEKMYLPYLPYRIEKPEKKLIFPSGKFTGYYTFFELRKALSLGYSIIKIYEGIVYFKNFSPFRDYVLSLYDMRKKQLSEKNALEIVTKACLNHLYGKFAQKIEDREEIIHESKVTMETISRYKNIFRSGEFFIIKKPYASVPAFVNPIFSIYTTAYARDMLYNYLSRCENSIYYFDTDSLITEKDFSISLELGELKKEFDIKDGILVKPKMYMLNGKGKCKGIGFLDEENFNKLIRERKSRITKFVKFKEANRRKLKYNEIIDVDKVINLEDNKRLWHECFNPEILQDSESLIV